jgi:hypothetical protein
MTPIESLKEKIEKQFSNNPNFEVSCVKKKGIFILEIWILSKTNLAKISTTHQWSKEKKNDQYGTWILACQIYNVPAHQNNLLHLKRRINHWGDPDLKALAFQGEHGQKGVIQFLKAAVSNPEKVSINAPFAKHIQIIKKYDHPGNVDMELN